MRSSRREAFGLAGLLACLRRVDRGRLACSRISATMQRRQRRAREPRLGRRTRTAVPLDELASLRQMGKERARHDRIAARTVSDRSGKRQTCAARLLVPYIMQRARNAGDRIGSRTPRRQPLSFLAEPHRTWPMERLRASAPPRQRLVAEHRAREHQTTREGSVDDLMRHRKIAHGKRRAGPWACWPGSGACRSASNAQIRLVPRSSARSTGTTSA